MNPCLDCGGSLCVCRANRELREAQEAVRVYEAFFQHVESCVLTPDGAFACEFEGVVIDGNEVRLTERAKDAWLAVCGMIDKRKGV